MQKVASSNASRMHPRLVRPIPQQLRRSTQHRGGNEQQVYAFVDAQACLNNGTAPSGGELPVSTTLATCPMTLNTGGSWANWDAFAAANPSDTIASALPFVIADVATGEQISVSNVDSTRS
jgi:hypothetical protein